MLLIILSKINIFRVQLVSGYSNTRIKPFYLIYLMLGTFFFTYRFFFTYHRDVVEFNSARFKFNVFAKKTIPEK